MRHLFRGLCMLLFALSLSGCWSDDCSNQGGSRTCSSYGSVTKCQTSSTGTVTCTTSDECTAYACCIDKGVDGRFCSGSNCSKACGWGFAATKFPFEFKSPELRLQLKDLSSDRVARAIANADINLAKAAGIRGPDFEKIAKGQELSSDVIDRIATRLNEKPETVAAVTRDLAASMDAQRKDVNSVYWQTCVQSGSWVTDRNIVCNETYWLGCSPATGASMCLTKAGIARLKSP